MMAKGLKKQSFLAKHKYAIYIFVFIMLYNFIFVNKCNFWQVSGYAYTFYLVDFSVGFHTGVLPGAIFNWLFGKHVSIFTASVYVFVLMTLFMIILSVLLEGIIKKALEAQKINIIWLVVFFTIGAYTVSDCFHWFGYFDMYFFFLSILFFACIENRIAAYLIPVIFVLSVMIHFSAFLTCVPLYTVILLFKIIQEPAMKKKYGLLLLVGLLGAFGLGSYLILFESSNLNYSLEEFHAYLAARGGADYREETRAYYDYAFYHTVTVVDYIQFGDNGGLTEGGLRGLFAYLANYLEFNRNLMFSQENGGILNQLAKVFVSIPFFVWYYQMIARYIKEKRKHKAPLMNVFPMLLTTLQLPMAIAAILFSADISRWVTHTVAILTAEILFFISKDCKLANKINQNIEIIKPWAFSYGFIVATSVF